MRVPETNSYQQQMANLDRQIRALQRKKVELARREHPVVAELRNSALLPSEFVTRKNRHKLEVMGRIKFILERHGRAGRSSADLHAEISLSMPELKFETFRSYLSRFKREGRLEHVPQHQMWRLPVRI